MSAAAASISDLRAQLGRRAENLQYAPLNEVQTTKQDDEPAALSFKIKFAFVREKQDDTKRQVWVLFYPSTTSGGQSQIHFQSYDSTNHKTTRYDPDNIGKIVTGCARAFKHTKKWSKAKHVALAKYYFLMKLAEEGNEADNEKMRHGVVISKTFVEDLATSCREFKEDVRRVSGQSTNSQIAQPHSTDSHDNELSDASSSPFVSERQQHASNTHSEGENGSGAVSVTSGLHVTAEPTKETAINTLIELADTEDTINEDTNAIDEEIAALRARCEKLEEQRQDVEHRKQTLLQSMSPAAAYSLGRSIERRHSAKRQRKE